MLFSEWFFTIFPHPQKNKALGLVFVDYLRGGIVSGGAG